MQKELKKRSTNVQEDTRRALNISRDEYALCSYVQYRAADARQKRAGWCCDDKDEIADFVGITRKGLYKMIARMELKGLMQTGAVGSLRVTPMWIEALAKCVLSTQKDVDANGNLVHTKWELSTHEMGTKYTRNGNLVPETNNVLSKKSKNKLEEEESAATPLCPPFEKVGEIYLEAEEEKNTPPVAPAPPLAATRIKLYDPELPKVTIIDDVPMKPTTEPFGTGRKTQKRNEPIVHPENEEVFAHFSEPSKARKAWGEWLKYKHEQHRERYKTPQSELIKLRSLWKDSGGDSETAAQMIEQAIGNLWKGIFKLKNEVNHGLRTSNKATEQHANLALYVAKKREELLESLYGGSVAGFTAGG